MKEKNLDTLVQKYLRAEPLGNKDAVAARREYARRELEHWQEIFAHGCNDPAWPDGCNLNLTRNHIIAAQGREWLDDSGREVVQSAVRSLQADGAARTGCWSGNFAFLGRRTF